MVRNLVSSFWTSCLTVAVKVNSEEMKEPSCSTIAESRARAIDWKWEICWISQEEKEESVRKSRKIMNWLMIFRRNQIANTKAGPLWSINEVYQFTLESTM
ncbi:hypothetical protein ACB098_03G010400 [Castanea mollissima]